MRDRGKRGGGASSEVAVNIGEVNCQSFQIRVSMGSSAGSVGEEKTALLTWFTVKSQNSMVDATDLSVSGERSVTFLFASRVFAHLQPSCPLEAARPRTLSDKLPSEPDVFLFFAPSCVKSRDRSPFL